MDLVEEQGKYRHDTENERRYWAEETSKLRKELDNMNGGYSSVRSVASTVSSVPGESDVDVALVLKLQHKLGEVERENNRLRARLDELEASPANERDTDSFRASELEVENAALKSQLRDLRRSIGDGSETRALLDQFNTQQVELERRREEIVQLRSVLAAQASLGPVNNEDGELALAYDTQKKINKQLELELQDEKSRYRAHELEYKLEIERLREDNERQQKLLAVNLTKSPAKQTEAYMQHEITPLISENLDYRRKWILHLE